MEKMEKYGLEENQIANVDLAFSEKVEERKLVGEIYAQIIQKDITKEVALEARELRLKAVKIKSGISSVHKTQKEFALAFGKYCDAWKRKETEPIQQMIDGLIEIEKFEEIQEQKRIAALQTERELAIGEFLIDGSTKQLGEMDDEVWNAYFEAKKKEHETIIQNKAIEDAEREAKAELEAQEKAKALEDVAIVNALNARLKKQAKERDEKEAKERAEREAAQRIQDEKIAKEKAEQKRIQDEERKKREALEKELKAKKDAEEQAKKDEAAKVQLELNKGDEQKVLDLVNDLNALKTKYTFKSKKNNEMMNDVEVLLERIVEHINE